MIVCKLWSIEDRTPTNWAESKCETEDRFKKVYSEIDEDDHTDSKPVSIKVAQVNKPTKEKVEKLANKALSLQEKEEILKSSKTSLKVLEFDSSMYDIEVFKSPLGPTILYKWMIDGCGKEFNKPQNFVVHLSMHTGTKQYLCQYCSKSFSQKGNMKKHMKKHEIPSLHDRKTIKWKFWDSLFTEKYNWQVFYLIS